MKLIAQVSNLLHRTRRGRVSILLTGPLAIVVGASAFPSQAAPDKVEIPRFSRMEAGTPVIGWSPLRPSPKAVDTVYALVRDGDTIVLKADARHSMSGLLHTVRVDVGKYPRIRWRWKISAPVAAADMSTKAGDDYAARIYVMFDYPLEKLSFGTRAKLKLAETLYGQKIPSAAVNYVWDNRHPVGTIAPNAYTDRARMMVVESGTARVGQWVTETRDLAADFRAAFGEEAPAVVAVALATDTDNTGESVNAWYGDIEFLQAAGPEVQ
ncbi:MAG: DUF3047 domain-containing protein [Burkholderiaceae bacterium]